MTKKIIALALLITIYLDTYTMFYIDISNLEYDVLYTFIIQMVCLISIIILTINLFKDVIGIHLNKLIGLFIVNATKNIEDINSSIKTFYKILERINSLNIDTIKAINNDIEYNKETYTIMVNLIKDINNKLNIITSEVNDNKFIDKHILERFNSINNRLAAIKNKLGNLNSTNYTKNSGTPINTDKYALNFISAPIIDNIKANIKDEGSDNDIDKEYTADDVLNKLGYFNETKTDTIKDVPNNGNIKVAIVGTTILENLPSTVQKQFTDDIAKRKAKSSKKNTNN